MEVTCFDFLFSCMSLLVNLRSVKKIVLTYHGSYRGVRGLVRTTVVCGLEYVRQTYRG